MDSVTGAGERRASACISVREFFSRDGAVRAKRSRSGGGKGVTPQGSKGITPGGQKKDHAGGGGVSRNGNRVTLLETGGGQATARFRFLPALVLLLQLSIHCRRCRNCRVPSCRTW